MRVQNESLVLGFFDSARSLKLHQCSVVKSMHWGSVFKDWQGEDDYC